MHDGTAPPTYGDEFRTDVVNGLSDPQKRLPCRWLYDERGSALFEDITRLAEYYPTRAETAILRDHAGELARFAGCGPVLIEYGAGAGVKTEILLRALTALRGYVPIDVSRECLADTAERIRGRFPDLWVGPLECNFLGRFDMPPGIPGGRRIGFFPGSTIGNLDEGEATAFLAQMLRHVGPEGGAIIGIDLRKDLGVLLRAYDDASGVTASFNLNILVRINRELGADFHLHRFDHAARWNADETAVEMHIVSLVNQKVLVGGLEFEFAEGETIHTESSRKYDEASFAALVRGAGWAVEVTWIDEDGLFGVFALSPLS